MEKRIGGRVEHENDSEVSDAVPPTGSSPPLHFNCSPASLLVWWASYTARTARTPPLRRPPLIIAVAPAYDSFGWACKRVRDFASGEWSARFG
jgi:hypothetical protein